MVKNLYKDNKNNNNETVKHINNGLIDLRNDINRKEIPENKNPKKVIDIVEKILDFDKQETGKRRPSDLDSVGKAFDRKRIKILTPKNMIQRLPIALAQVKAGNTSKNLLNETRQIVYSLYREKEVIKKVYNMDSMTFVYY